ncbi:MAG: hypothetical protein OMM_08646 [Candidatus Magnetoglobus multicellularis str. Araruama]|uniref:Uncharacterized protein n=1 Tax=Candidatus Magnetoglobus multicellularis str. Araruama TaxID=890399 RepID=A0A1V1P795_9BACT|nr:MAG: hypothetical protein OMM_08646 [Candidatus Magnetoglobus multicellularis str. Araruama]
MDQRKIINIAKLYADTVRNLFNAGISQIILFGSYAKNNANQILLAFGAGYTCSLYFILDQTREIMHFNITVWNLIVLGH